LADDAQVLRNRIERMARRGFRGYPLGTVAYYGPNDRVASKVVAAVLASEHAPAEPMAKWVSGDLDVRDEPTILSRVLHFLTANAVRSVVVTPGIYGCPHEEGLDYPLGEPCHLCPFWENRDREQIFKGR